MHKVIYKWGWFDYINSDRVDEIFTKWKKREIIKIWNNIKDTINIKSIDEVSEDEEMIYKVLKNQNSYINKKVREEIEKYPYELSLKIVENMINKYK